MYQKTAADRIEGSEHRPLFRLTGRLDAQVRPASGPAARQIGVRKRFGFVEEHQINRACCGPGFQVGKALTAGRDRGCVLPAFERVARATEGKPLCRN